MTLIEHAEAKLTLPAFAHQSQTTVSTPDAQRLLKRLCLHFSQKVSVQLADVEGLVDFEIGCCLLESDDDGLKFDCAAPTIAELLEVQDVISRHLLRFSGDRQLQALWPDSD